MVLKEGGGGADLNGVRVIGRVLKQAVVRVEDLAREKKEKFSTWATIVQPVCLCVCVCVCVCVYVK